MWIFDPKYQTALEPKLRVAALVFETADFEIILMTEIVDTVDLSDHPFIKQEIEGTYSNDEEEPVGCINPYLSTNHEQEENEPCIPVKLELHPQRLSSSSSHIKDITMASFLQNEQSKQQCETISVPGFDSIYLKEEISLNSEGEVAGDSYVFLENSSENCLHIKTEMAPLLYDTSDAIAEGYTEQRAAVLQEKVPVEMDDSLESTASPSKLMRIDASEKQYDCELCKKTFVSVSKLYIHQKKHLPKTYPYKCQVCDKTSYCKSFLARHMRIHTGVTPYQCEICNKKFVTSSKLSGHRRIHTGEKPFECPVCKRTFALSSGLTSHQRIHTGEKPYQCDTCDKTFKFSSNLSEHRRSHTGEKPFECAICKKTFSRSSSLCTHQRIHIGDKAYKCGECNLSFSRKRSLNKHVKSHIKLEPVVKRLHPQTILPKTT
ncbi:zinc finger protein 235-like isoform X1 [Artemia franciscana]|uniref:zinc finger protein 235-like isoform X1 n=2 Tax=Artemia franciscana TaxID=6661 RepID=UPI0032DAC1A2